MGKRAGKILVVDDNAGIRRALEFVLKGFFEDVKILGSPLTILSDIETFKPDVILLDMNFKADINTGGEGLFWLKEIKKSSPGVEVVLFTAYADIQLAVQGMKIGAADFVEKPWDNAKLIATLRDAVAKSRKRKDSIAKSIFRGQNPAMQDFWRNVAKLAGVEIPVIIIGEKGTGKKLAANEIHCQSLRNIKSFEICRFEKTPENIDRLKGGTLAVILNDEPDQSKLLSLKNKCEESDVRLIFLSETAVTLPGMIELRTLPLRSIQEDIIGLSDHIVRELNNKHNRDIEEIDNETRDLMINYRWPGNIGELYERLERAVVMCESNIIRIKEIFGDDITDPSFLTELKKKSAEEEISIIRNVLENNGRNIAAAAKILNISRPTLYAKIKKFNL